MKRTGSPKKYEAYIRENREFFSRIPKSAFDVIDVCTRIKDIRNCIKFEQHQKDREEESIMERLQRKLNLSEGKARDYLKKYRKRLV